MPEGVVIRWWSDRGRALAFYAAAAAAVLVVLALRTGQFQTIHRVLMGAFAIGCAYFALVRVVNVTTLRIEEDRLLVQHGPLPWRSNMSVALAQVADLVLDRASSRVQLRTAAGEELPLVDDVKSTSAARIDGELTRLIGRGSEDDAG